MILIKCACGYYAIADERVCVCVCVCVTVKPLGRPTIAEVMRWPANIICYGDLVLATEGDL